LNCHRSGHLALESPSRAGRFGYSGRPQQLKRRRRRAARDRNGAGFGPGKAPARRNADDASPRRR
jgi:hypothetical protein